MIESFWLCFVPLFVAVDPIGLLPVFMTLTEGIQDRQVRKIIFQSTLTALIVAIVFIAVGRAFFRFLNISVADFLVAGGTLLFIISVSDLLAIGEKCTAIDPESVGVVPIGVPLITGPAVLTTSLILIAEHSNVITSLAIAANILIAGVVFSAAPLINRVIGTTGSKAISKIVSLLLAAIGVMFVRRGILLIIAEGIPS
jgi:multiple antibiotic resistance protein